MNMLDCSARSLFAMTKLDGVIVNLCVFTFSFSSTGEIASAGVQKCIWIRIIFMVSYCYVAISLCVLPHCLLYFSDLTLME